jgi:hypothetical protein
MQYSHIRTQSSKSAKKDTVENFNDKIDSALSLLIDLKISQEEKELLKMSLESMNEFVVNHYGEKK